MNFLRFQNFQYLNETKQSYCHVYISFHYMKELYKNRVIVFQSTKARTGTGFDQGTVFRQYNEPKSWEKARAYFFRNSLVQEAAKVK